MANGRAGAPDDLIDLAEASDILEVTPDRIGVMVEEGLLEPAGPVGERRFVRAHVIAVRELGA
jgi:hypothetical protein